MPPAAVTASNPVSEIASPSTSVSLPNQSVAAVNTSGVSSIVVNGSPAGFGGSLTGATVTVTVARSLSVPSLTV